MAASDSTRKKFYALYKITGIIMVLSALIMFCFGVTVVAGYMDSKDYEEGVCTVTKIETARDDDNELKEIWCSCNDNERTEDPSPCSDRPSKSFSIPCLKVYVQLKNSNTRSHMWLKERDIHSHKGKDCSNSCDDREILLSVGDLVECDYDPSDDEADAYRNTASFSCLSTYMFPPAVVFLLAFIGFIVTVVFHIRSNRRASTSYA